jgi:hypothetical protein
MIWRDPTKLEEAHARAVVSLLNAVPQCSEEQAEEVVESFTGLILYTLQAFLPTPGDDDATNH